MNVITLTGHTTKEIELTYSPSGTAFAKGTLAVRRDFKNQDGEYETDFINFTSIGKISETIANYVKKGDKFGITGRLQVRTYESDGKRQYFTEVVVNGFDFPPKRDNNQSNTNTPNNSYGGGNSQQNTDNGYQSRTSNNSYTRTEDDPFSGGNNVDDIDSDDLPF